MKFATTWNAVQFLAETEEDAKILGTLKDLLAGGTDNCYDRGSIEIMSPKDADDSEGFTSEEVENSGLVLEFNR